MGFLSDLAGHAFVSYSGKCNSCGTVTHIVCNKCNSRTFRASGTCKKCNAKVDPSHPAYSRCIKCGKNITMVRQLNPKG